MKYFLLFLFFLSFNDVLSAQSLNQDSSSVQQGKVYELKLKAPVKCIQKIEYEKSGLEPDWKLLDDKRTILIQDYIINTKVKLKVIYETGKEEEFSQSPCSIKLSEAKPFL